MGNILLPQCTRSVLCNEITPLVTLCISCDDLREESVLVCVCDIHTSGQIIHHINQPRPVQQSLSRLLVAQASISRADRRLGWTLTDLSLISSPPWSLAQREVPGLCHLFEWSHSPRWGPGRGQKTRGHEGLRHEKRLAFHRSRLRAEPPLLSLNTGWSLFVYLAVSMAVKTIRTASFP